MSKEVTDFDAVALQRSDAEDFLGANLTLGHDIKENIQATAERWQNRLKRLGNLVVRRRVGLSAIISAATGAVAVGMTIKGAMDVNLLDTYREAICTFTGIETTPEPQVITSDYETDVAVGGAAAATSGAACLGYLALRHDKEETRLSGNAAEHSYTTPYSAPRDPLTLFLTPEEWHAKERQHRIQADAYYRAAEELAQQNEARDLAQEIVDTFGGAPRPTSTIYLSSNYKMLHEAEIAGMRPAPLPEMPSDWDMHEYEMREYVANNPNVTVDFEGDVPLQRVLARAY
jgi:hypothetical protein